MAVQIVTQTPTLTAAAYGAWGQAIHNALSALGFVNTADTGQVNWTTVSGGANPAAGALVGYEVWRFADTLQSTRPIYFRVEYRTASTSAYGYLQFLFGTGSDGAGNLTGSATNTISMHGFNSGSVGGGTGDWRLSSDGSNLFALGAWGSVASRAGNQALLFSRTQNNDGTYNSDGWWWHNSDSSVLSSVGIYNAAGNAVSNTSTTNGGFAPLGNSTGSTLTSGADLYLAPLMVIVAGKVSPPSNVYACYPGDVADGATITISGHTFLAVTTTFSKTVVMNAANASDVTGKHLIKWE